MDYMRQSRGIFQEVLSTAECPNGFELNIGPMIILIPCMVFVLPPLACSVMALLCWKRQKRRDSGRGIGTDDRKLEDTESFESSSVSERHVKAVRESSANDYMC